MCKSREVNGKDIFRAIGTAMSEYNVSWDKCVSLGVDNTYQNVECHNSAIVETRKKNKNILIRCPCHVVHNAQKKKQQMSLLAPQILILLVDIYFHLDYLELIKIF